MRIPLLVALVASTSASAGQGWTWVQDSALIFCNAGSNPNGCSNNIVGTITPTVTGSVWVLQVGTSTNVTISSVTGGGGTWIHCPKCHISNPGGFNFDVWYNLTGNAGTGGDAAHQFSFSLSGSAGNVLSANFVELLPPPGTTASLDDSGGAIGSGCTTCSAVPLNVTGTDAIIQMNGGAASWNAWSPPYITDGNGDGFALNVTSGAAPTLTLPNAGNPTFSALAFKASPNIAPPPPPEYAIVNFTPVYGPAPKGCTSGGQGYGISCSPSCSFPIPTTGAGHLLFVEAGDEYGNFIQSISGAGSWVIPAGPNSCQFSASQHGLSMQGENASASCAYVLSTTPGATSLQVTMSGNASTAFAVWEIGTTNGSSFAFDTQGSTGDKAALFWPGQPLTLSGANDVIFQLGWDVGGSLGPSYYGQPTILSFYNYFMCNQVASVILLDSGPTAPTPVWINDNANYDTFVTGVAFKTTGGSTPPDAGTAPDAGHGVADAGPAADAGCPCDAGTPLPDAGTVPADAGPRTDSGTVQPPDAGGTCCSADADGGSMATGGFGCATGAGPGPLPLLLSLAAWALGACRRRRRAAAGGRPPPRDTVASE